MVRHLKVWLEKPSSLYVPGEIVSGNLYVEVDKPKPYKTISVTISGIVIVSATLTLPTEELFKESSTLWQAERAEDGTSIELPPGSYNYPFRFALPFNLPTSFEGQHGRILYRITGKVSTGFLKMDHTVNKTITIFNSVVFDNLSVLVPKRYDSENIVGMTCCYPCISGPVRASLHLPRTGFCLGETIPFSVNINNRGGSSVQLVATLKLQETYWQSSGNRKCVVKIVGTTASEFIRRRRTSTWSEVSIPIGNGSPLSLSNCDRICVTYSFDLKVNIQRVFSSVGTNSIQLCSVPILVADATNAHNRALLSQHGFSTTLPQSIPLMNTGGPAAPMTTHSVVPLSAPPAVNPNTQFGSLPRPHPHSYHYNSPTGLPPRAGFMTNRSMSLPTGVGPPPTAYNWPPRVGQQSYQEAPLYPLSPGTQRIEEIEDSNAEEPVPSAPVLESAVSGERPRVSSVVSPQPLPGELPPSYDEIVQGGQL